MSWLRDDDERGWVVLKFRNLDVDPAQPVAEWGVEGILSALERGSAADWGRILNAVEHDTTGVVRRQLDEAVECADPDLGVLALFR